jgi:hypothetical protein
MKDQTNEEPLDPLPGKLPVTAGRPGTASAQDVEKQGAAPVDPDALCGGCDSTIGNRGRDQERGGATSSSWGSPSARSIVLVAAAKGIGG